MQGSVLAPPARRVFAALVLGIGLWLAGASAAHATGTVKLSVTTAGLPAGQQPVITIDGPGFRRQVVRRPDAVLRLRRGRYVIRASRVRVRRAGHSIKSGAVAYPAKRRQTVRLRRGDRHVLVRYAGIVNPHVRALPRKTLGVLGNASRPRALVLSSAFSGLRAGTVFVGGPSRRLPHGLVSRVTRVQRQGHLVLAYVTPVAVSNAVPALTYAGRLPLAASRKGASSARAQIASACDAPQLLRFGAHLDSAEVREASWDAWHAQMRLTVAVRTTESLGVAAAAAGINCDWTLTRIGPWQAAVPVGPIVVPVYATLPVKAGIHVNGRLNAGVVHIASTTVATVAAGASNSASLSQQGSNVWLTDAPSISGSARLYASVGLQAGIGVAKGANVHVEADFGPEFTWASGQSCQVVLDMGSLSAGLSILGRNLNTPSFTPWKLPLWTGCSPRSAPSTPSPTPPVAAPTPGGPAAPLPTPTPAPAPPPASRGFTIEDSVYGGTWARFDPNNGTWYAHGSTPPNGKYWFPNGLGVAVDCARSAAAYPVTINGQHQTWSWWAHVTDNTWVPTAVFSTVWNDGNPGVANC